MRVTFPRLEKGRRIHSVVERPDGVTYVMDGGVAGSGVPHDLVHFVTEHELGMRDGIWGAVAAGAVFRSMRHVGGRRPPHTGERSAEIIRGRRRDLTRAELLGGLVQLVADRRLETLDAVRAVTRGALATLPPPDCTVDDAAILRAARRLRAVELEWAALEVGQELTVDWPEPARKRRRRR